jgi:hypothetical protein
MDYFLSLSALGLFQVSTPIGIAMLSFARTFLVNAPKSKLPKIFERIQQIENSLMT